ncbi:MAG: hypothetical protein Q8L48_00440 [Archangium sp.]|nr:hypothetical protein [Archangium sp.]
MNGMFRPMCRHLPLLLTLVALAACPPPIEPDCQRVLVDLGGNVNQGFAGGVGGGTGAAPPPLGFAGSSQNVTLFAPLSSCVSDTLRVDVSVLDPDNRELTAEVGTPARFGVNGAVKVDVAFTPTKAGLHTVRVAFEPSLGARSLLLEVASDGLAGLTTRVPIPQGANCLSNALWPLSDDTVACEERATGRVSLSSSDGGLVQFAGGQLVVVDSVLWSIDATSNTLERRVFEDGGVRLTDSFQNFPSVATPGMHDVDRALRFRSNGRLTLVHLKPAGPLVQELQLDGQVGPPLAYFAEDNDTVYRWSPARCVFSSCTNFEDVVGLEPGYVWRTPNTFEQPRGPEVSGFVRPTDEAAPARLVLFHAAEPVTTPAFAFERIPLWLSVGGNKRVLVTVERDSARLSFWPGGVLRVGRHHLVLTDPDPGFVRVVRR